MGGMYRGGWRRDVRKGARGAGMDWGKRGWGSVVVRRLLSLGAVEGEPPIEIGRLMGV